MAYMDEIIYTSRFPHSFVKGDVQMAYMDEIIYHQVNDSSNEIWLILIIIDMWQYHKSTFYVYPLEVQDQLYVEN